jgi:hypothetical protein
VILAYVPDLMDRSKVAAGREVTLVASPAQLVAQAGPTTTIVVDLSRPGVLEVLGVLVATGARVVAFGSHVDRERLDAARAAGAEVLARSAFFSDLARVLG